jgi:hypothetical protein
VLDDDLRDDENFECCTVHLSSFFKKRDGMSSIESSSIDIIVRCVGVCVHVFGVTFG